MNSDPTVFYLLNSVLFVKQKFYLILNYKRRYGTVCKLPLSINYISAIIKVLFFKMNFIQYCTFHLGSDNKEAICLVYSSCAIENTYVEQLV